MGKWDHRNEGKRISQSLLQEKSTEDLRNSQRFIKGLLDLRKSQKLTKTYIDGTKKAIAYNGTPRVFVDYRFDGTATGRLSCAAYTAKQAMGVSFHTLPRDKAHNIRSLFDCPKDYRFITVDYAAMELRVLSHIAKDGNMQTAFMKGADLHTYTAQMLFNKEKISKDERQIAKAISFLIAYGGGAFNLAETTGITVAKAKRIISNYQRSSLSKINMPTLSLDVGETSPTLPPRITLWSIVQPVKGLTLPSSPLHPISFCVGS